MASSQERNRQIEVRIAGIILAATIAIAGIERAMADVVHLCEVHLHNRTGSITYFMKCIDHDPSSELDANIDCLLPQSLSVEGTTSYPARLVEAAGTSPVSSRPDSLGRWMPVGGLKQSGCNKPLKTNVPYLRDCRLQQKQTEDRRKHSHQQTKSNHLQQGEWPN